MVRAELQASSGTAGDPGLVLGIMELLGTLGRSWGSWSGALLSVGASGSGQETRPVCSFYTSHCSTRRGVPGVVVLWHWDSGQPDCSALGTELPVDQVVLSCMPAYAVFQYRTSGQPCCFAPHTRRCSALALGFQSDTLFCAACWEIAPEPSVACLVLLEPLLHVLLCLGDFYLLSYSLWTTVVPLGSLLRPTCTPECFYCPLHHLVCLEFFLSLMTSVLILHPLQRLSFCL